MVSDTVRYSGEAGKLAKMLDRAEMSGRFKLTSRIAYNFAELARSPSRADYFHFDDRGQAIRGDMGKTSSDLTPELFATYANGQEASRARNILFIGEREADLEGITGKIKKLAQTRTSTIGGGHVLTLVGIPYRNGLVDPSFSIDTRQGKPSASLEMDLKITFSEALEFVGRVSRDPTAALDVLMRMNGARYKGNPINLLLSYFFDPSMVPVGHQDEVFEDRYYNQFGGFAHRIPPNVLPRPETIIQSKTGFDK